MVQQLSLVGTVPKSEFNLVINSLVALTGQKPQLLSKNSTIYKPIVNLKYYQAKQTFNTSVNLNQLEQFHVTVSQLWDIYPKGVKNTNVIVNEILANSDETFIEKLKSKEIKVLRPKETETAYNLQISDIPAGGKRSISSQTIYETNFSQTQEGLTDYMTYIGYVKKQECFIKGLQFLYNGIIHIEIFQIYSPKSSNDDELLEIIDVAENWFLKVFINVAKITDITAINQATNELLALQKNLDNLIKLKIPDRNSMDSRVNNIQ